jgi:site-specific DNA recombinase
MQESINNPPTIEGTEKREISAPRALIYSRVSTDEQARGYSLQTQRESCQRYCDERGYTALANFDDAHSGTEIDRPGLNALIDATKELRPDVIVLHDVDRLGREIIVQAIAERDLSRYGARIEYVLGGGSGSPDQELLKFMKQGIAVYENRQRVERSKRGKDARVRAGHVLVAARPSYGYRYVAGDRSGHFEIHPEEAAIVRRMFNWCVDDGLTTYEIAKRLHAEGVPTRGDTNPVVSKKTAQHFWDPSTVACILRNPIHKGQWFWNKTKLVEPDADLVAKRRKAGAANPERKQQVARPREEWLSLTVPAIVDEATWERAQERLSRNKQQAKRNSKREYLLRGLVFCPCGRRWTGRYKNHLERAYYRCPTTEGEPWRKDCTARFGIEQTKLERGVLDAVKAFLLDPDVRKAALDAERERATTEREQLADDLATIDKRLSRVEHQLGKLLDDLLLEDFPEEIIANRKRDLIAERQRLAAEREQRLTALDEPVIDVEMAIAELAPTVETAFAIAEPFELRQLLDLLRVQVHVIDRETVRLSGVLGSVVTLSCSLVR